MKTKHYISTFVLVLSSIILFGYFYYSTSPQVYQLCTKCDANSYLKIYENYRNNTDLSVDSPFNTRVFVPFLASLGPFTNPIRNFHIVNLAFIIFSVIAIYFLWIMLQIPKTLKFIGFFWLFFHWTGLIRHKLFDPINADTPLYFFHTLLLLIIYKRKYIWLPILAIIATSQKESFPAYLIILFIYGLLHNKFYEKYFDLKILFLSVVLSFGTKTALTYLYPPSNEGVSSFIAVLFYLKEIIVHPTSIILWIVAVFTSYGVFILIPIFNKSKYVTTPENNILAVFAFLSLFLSIAAGGDYTRISFLGFPFIMTFILLKLKETPLFITIVAFMLSIPILRLFSSIPQPDYQNSYHPWFIEFSDIQNIVFWGIYMLICAFILNRLTKIIR